jgi:plasmid stabilization system protein ParE
MDRKVIISKTAEKRLEELFKYLLENWSQKIKLNFIKKLDDKIRLIKQHPEAFPESEKEKGLRKCVITRHTTMFYRFNSKQISIITFFDTRQNPKKLKEDL